MRAKKHLGQHFLESRGIVQDIVRAGKVDKTNIVLEIGAGKGILTGLLLKKVKRVIAFEKDGDLATRLSDKFKETIREKKLFLIHDDIFNLKERGNIARLLTRRFVLIANIPYYITGKLLRFMLYRKTPPQKAVLLLQKEVAERIVARDGKESILSISVKAVATPKIIRRVPARYFNPPPRVDSTVIVLENISRKRLSGVNEDIFFSLLKKGFSQKRKVVKKNIGATDELLRACEILPQSRAEDLSCDNWACLATLYEKISH